MTKILYKSVCSECAGFSLGRYIKSYGINDTCDYCGKECNFTLVIENILFRMFESWKLYFSNFEESDFSEEFRTPYYIADIVDDEISELNDANDEFLTDLRNIQDDHIWQKDSEYWTPLSEALKLSWERFSEIVKTNRRYTYFLCENDFFDPATYSPLETMKMIYELLKSKASLIYELQPKTSLYRTRNSNESFNICVKELGAVPFELSKSNRFSPKGVSMFYCSLDQETCKLEAVGKNTVTVTAEFYNAKPIKILDLTNIPEIPKLYDDDFMFIPALEFLHYFSQEISKNSDENELNYIPTQILTEFLRFQRVNDLAIKGIKYNSSKRQGGKNLVLFYSNEDCKDSDDGSDCLIFNGIIE